MYLTKQKINDSSDRIKLDLKVIFEDVFYYLVIKLITIF